MAIIEDAQLLGKKILVTVVIYIVPVTILAGGLWLIKHSLSEKAQSRQTELNTVQN